MDNFRQERQKILKSMNDTICLTRHEAEVLCQTIEKMQELLGRAAEEIENLYGCQTDLSEEIRGLLGGKKE